MSNKQQIWMDSILLTLAFGVIYALFLGYFPLISPDEGRYAEIAREMVITHQYLVPHLNFILYFEKPILFYWLTAASIHLFGLSEWVIRLWPATFAVLGATGTYLVARFLYDRTTGIFSAIILSSSVLYFAMGHYANLDMTLTFFLTISLYATLIGIKLESGFKKRLAFWVAAVAAALAVLTKGLIGFVFPVMIAGLFVLLLNQWHRLKKWYLPTTILLFLLIALPWHIALQLKVPSFFHFYFIRQQFTRYSTLDATRYEPFYFYSLVFIGGFFPWSLFIPQAFRYSWPTIKTRHHHYTECFLLIWFFSILLFFSFSDSQLIPYILPIFPPAAILVGKYFRDKLEIPTVGIFIGFLLLAIIAIVLIGFALMLPRFYDLAQPETAKIYLLALAFWLLIISFTAHSFARRMKIAPAFYSLAIGFFLFLVSALPALPSIDHRSIKPLAKIINQLIQPGDKVVAYNHYYQDLPFYTQQKVITVNWFQNELQFGIEHQSDAKQWMISSDEFWKLYDSPTRVFMIVHRWNLPDIRKSHPNTKLYIIDSTQRNFLISNQGSNDAKN